LGGYQAFYEAYVTNGAVVDRRFKIENRGHFYWQNAWPHVKNFAMPAAA
jgi:hypothetical protein